MRRSNLEKFLTTQTLMVYFGSMPGTQNGPPRADAGAVRVILVLMFSGIQGRRQSGELLVLRLGWQRSGGFGASDDLGEQAQAERRQCALPQFTGGFTLLDEDPVLRRDRAGVHAIGEVVDGTASDRVALLDSPFDCRHAAV